MKSRYKCTKLEKIIVSVEIRLQSQILHIFHFLWVLAFKPSTNMLKSIQQLWFCMNKELLERITQVIGNRIYRSGEAVWGPNGKSNGREGP